MKPAVALAFVFLLLGAGDAGAALPTGLFTLYSDMCIHPESGDPHGVRIGFLKITGGFYIFYEGTDGWNAPPQIVPWPEGGFGYSQSLQFPVTVGGKMVMFDGVMTARAIDGSLAGHTANDFGKPGSPTHLPRVNPQAALPICK